MVDYLLLSSPNIMMSFNYAYILICHLQIPVTGSMIWLIVCYSRVFVILYLVMSLNIRLHLYNGTNRHACWVLHIAMLITC